MKQLYLLPLLLLGLFVFSNSQAQKLTITANHSDAKFILLNDYDDSEKQELGTGTIEYKLEKNLKNRIKITKPGYQPVIKEYDKDLKWDKDQNVVLDVRRVDVTAEPFDAEIFVDGRRIGTKAIFVTIPKDRSATIEVRKPGFAPLTRTYYNSPDRETPPIRDYFELKDRQVRVEVQPADGSVTVNGNLVGKGNQDVNVPNGDCVTVTVSKDGFVEYERVYCNKPGIDPEPPTRETVALEERLVRINTVPSDAAIEIQGQRMGLGAYDVKIPKGQCVRVTVSKDGFVKYYKDYCNQANRNEPPIQETIEMARDQAYDNSVSSDLANVRITVPVDSAYSAEEAWRILSSIVTRYFDILETVDFNTGYLTTSWQVENFNSAVIRTRVIVSSGGNSDQLAYAVKLVSQAAELNDPNRTKEVITVKDDEYFRDWSRIMIKYQGLIEEIQARIQ
ncbi:PEGA domain-containing protein [Algoriphagus formosus]|uniref:PEGA domain-containing protein n=1 Tax=Algoriphagus formosus TaxID=2007308 RepID=UPI003F72FDA2